MQRKFLGLVLRTAISAALLTSCGSASPKVTGEIPASGTVPSQTSTNAYITNSSTKLVAADSSAYNCSSHNPFSVSYMKTWTRQNRAKKFQVYAIDLIHQCEYRFGTSSKVQYRSASTSKFLIAVAVFSKIDHKRLSYKSVKNDLDAMITQSDNDATLRLLRRIGGLRTISSTARQLGLQHTQGHKSFGTTLTNAHDQALALRRVFADNPQFLSSTSTKRLQALLTHVTTTQRWGAGAMQVPSNWHVGVKNGWYHTAAGDEPPVNRSRVNTIGIVWNATFQPQLIFAGFSNDWKTDEQGKKAWNVLAIHVGRTLVGPQ